MKGAVLHPWREWRANPEDAERRQLTERLRHCAFHLFLEVLVDAGTNFVSSQDWRLPPDMQATRMRDATARILARAFASGLASGLRCCTRSKDSVARMMAARKRAFHVKT